MPAFVAGLPAAPRRGRRLRLPAAPCASLPTPHRRAAAAAGAAAAALLASTLSQPLSLPPRAAPAHAAPSPLQGNTLARRYVVTDGGALLRYALPLDARGDGLRGVQALLEGVGVSLRGRGAQGTPRARRDVARVDAALRAGAVDVLLGVPARVRLEASGEITALRAVVGELAAEVGAEVGGGGGVGEVVRGVFGKGKVVDVAEAERLRGEALRRVGRLEELLLGDSGLPYRIPRRFDALPRLEGRAEVQFVIRKKEKGEKVGIVMTLDGYSAPLNAGNLVDLVTRGVYNGTVVKSASPGFFLQFDTKDGEYMDPFAGARRNVPMEVLVVGETTPLWGATLDDAGLGGAQPVLPVTAYGAVAAAHSTENVNDASSAWYVFLFDPKSYEARAGNALNGSISCYGYVTEGADALAALGAGDVVEKASVLSGGDRFRGNAKADRGLASIRPPEADVFGPQ